MATFRSRLSSRRLRAAAFLVVVACLALAAWAFDPYRKIPFTRSLNPVFWVQHWRGEDTYDANTALLQHGDFHVPEVALTFDDGPDPRYGPAIAQFLKARGIPATFFVIGVRVKQYPSVLREIAADGFEIGDHTYNHQRLPPLKPHEIANELRLCATDIHQVTGQQPTLMRPPGVDYDAKVLHVAKALGFVTVSWTVGAKDYGQEPPASYITTRVLDRTENGSIILLHQTSPETLAALPAIVQGLQARGYRFVTISQMLTRLHARLPQQPPSPQ